MSPIFLLIYSVIIIINTILFIIIDPLIDFHQCGFSPKLQFKEIIGLIFINLFPAVNILGCMIMINETLNTVKSLNNNHDKIYRFKYNYINWKDKMVYYRFKYYKFKTNNEFLNFIRNKIDMELYLNIEYNIFKII